MRSWKPGSAKTSEEPRFLSLLEVFEGRNRLSQVVLWHLPCGKYWLEDPLSGLCLELYIRTSYMNMSMPVGCTHMCTYEGMCEGSYVCMHASCTYICMPVIMDE